MLFTKCVSVLRPTTLIGRSEAGRDYTEFPFWELCQFALDHARDICSLEMRFMHVRPGRPLRCILRP